MFFQKHVFEIGILQEKMKYKGIIRHIRDALPKGKNHGNRIKRMPEEEIKKASKDDHDNPRWTKKMLNSAQLQIPQKKVLIHMYLDQNIVDWFKSEGKGYQTRINSVLKSYVQKRS